MRLCETLTGIVIGHKAGRSTIRLTNSAKVKVDGADIRIGDKVIVAMNWQTGKVASAWEHTTRTPDPTENQPPEEEHFGFYEED